LFEVTLTNYCAGTPKNLFLILALCAALCACSKKNEPILTLTGASTIAPLAQELGQRFEQLHPGVKVNVQAGGSSRGVADVRSGLAQIGMVSRALKADEADLTAYTVARDGVAMIVHRDNPLSALAHEQVVAIYTGSSRDWADVGGPKHGITVVNKAEGRSTLDLFLHHFHLKAERIKADVVIGDNQQGIKTVAGNPFAIGYVSIGTAEYEVSHGTPIKLLPLAGVAPTTASVRDGSFPLARPLNLVTRGTPSDLARQFIAFAQSKQAHASIEKEYFVPVSN
jgi:phosphate transport system substrate-binding protein